MRRTCLRYILTQCRCNERFDDMGLGCVPCPAGTRPSIDNKRCVDVNCTENQIFRSDLMCPQCEWCPTGTTPNARKDTCVVSPRPGVSVTTGVIACDAFSVLSVDKKECVKCPNGNRASDDNLRCMSGCNGDKDITQADGTCFTCTNGYMPD